MNNSHNQDKHLRECSAALKNQDIQRNSAINESRGAFLKMNNCKVKDMTIGPQFPKYHKYVSVAH